MMVIFFYGVKGSVTFNHVLNVFNLLSWIITIGFGLFFVQPQNWEDFMPFGFGLVNKNLSESIRIVQKLRGKEFYRGAGREVSGGGDSLSPYFWGICRYRFFWPFSGSSFLELPPDGPEASPWILGLPLADLSHPALPRPDLT